MRYALTNVYRLEFLPYFSYPFPSVISDEAVLACFDHLAQEYLAKLAADCPLSLERQLLHKYLLHGGLNLPPLTFYDATTKTLRNRRQRQRRKERQRQKKAQAAAQADNVEQPTPPLPTHSARSSVPSMPEDMAEELAALSLQAPPDRIGASSPEPTDPTDTDSTAYLSVPSARPAAFFEAHTVNFTLFARYYFSHHLLVLEPMFDMDKLTAFPVAVGNFLEHAQRINACPEYHEDIDQAIAVVRQAQRHLVSLRRAFYLMPGKPNMARSARFDGEFKYILEPVPWAIAELEPECTLSPTDYQTLIAAIPADATIVQSRQQLRVVATVDSTTGLATLYPWTVDPADWTLDTPVTPPSDSSDQYTIDMGPTLCQYLSPGFIIEACYHTLSDGTHYCDSVTAVWPPYYAVVNEFAQRLAK
ncbi:hypothetical protein H4R34_001580 [Dimargaris verticillata]|uniref:Uncharacterized protein n=1 Tax=Dimargaris verticillata TaxID=2761393 RepID=A0A9W8EED3_9FUNG|nr:hypothetical protein H4R34_001580 [Dimargaris verticillata]